MSLTGWERAAHALVRHVPARVEGSGPRAAVALVLRDSAGGPELLFIRRAEHALDPWSGHIGFPGGRAEPGDPSLEATAVRETFEETGIDLAEGARLLGRLDEIRALARGRPVDLVISPFVFAAPAATGAPSLEVVSLHWLRLDRLLAPESRSHLDHAFEEGVVALPCLRIEGLVIWGLTFRMFENLAAVITTGA